MILAAGLGKRMQPLTFTTPKPLIPVLGRPMIDYSYDRLAADGVKRIIVNAHYLPDQIRAWANSKSAPPVSVTDETALLLDTGGGVVNAIARLGFEPFYVLNGDSFWLETRPVLERLRRNFDPKAMDALLLLCPLDRAVGYDGPGDFHIEADGRLVRRGQRTSPAYVYAGCQLVRPALFANAPEGPFSTNLLWDRAVGDRRLFGIAHDDLWLHVGTPAAIPLAEQAMRAHS